MCSNALGYKSFGRLLVVQGVTVHGDSGKLLMAFGGALSSAEQMKPEVMNEQEEMV